MARSLPAAVLLLVLGVVPSVARADSGEVAVGAGPSLRWPKAVGGELGARLGVGDFLAADLRLGGGARTTARGYGYAEAGVAALFDVLTWVPELRLGVGAEVDHGDVAPVVHLTAGLRRYLTADVSTALEAGAAWTPEEWRGTLALTFWLALL